MELRMFRESKPALGHLPDRHAAFQVADLASLPPPWRQPRGETIVSSVNSHTNATLKR